MTARWCVAPDLQDELVVALLQAEAALWGLDGWAVGSVGEELGRLEGWVPPLAGRTALEALVRISDVLRPTQGPPDRPSRRQLGPDGRYEHTPLRFVLLGQHDLDAVAAAAQLLGRHVVLRPHSELAKGADAAAACAQLSSGRYVVELLARLHGALDLEWTADAELLRIRLTKAGPAADADRPDGEAVVFTAAEEAAYQRLADRFNGMWASGDPLARWVY